MVDGVSGRHRMVIVVASAHDALASEFGRLTAGYEVDIQRCDDVYDATADLVLSGDRCVLVVGRLGELAKEGGRFFAVAARSRARCCGLLDVGTPVEPSVVPAAVRAGVLVVSAVDEIKGVFDAWLAGGGCASHDPLWLDEEHRATEAELNALLGQDTDE